MVGDGLEPKLEGVDKECATVEVATTFLNVVVISTNNLGTSLHLVIDIYMRQKFLFGGYLVIISQ